MRYWQLQLVLLAFFAGLVLIPRVFDLRSDHVRSMCGHEQTMARTPAARDICAEFGR